MVAPSVDAHQTPHSKQSMLLCTHTILGRRLSAQIGMSRGREVLLPCHVRYGGRI
ncbi:unnamed protein product [Ectocarpus sp. 8 AP-2014]